MASFLVPVFLALGESNLLKALLENKSPLTTPDAFVFFGFCLLAGIASNRFITSLSERVLQQVRRTQEEVNEIREQTEPLLEQITESEELEEENVRVLDKIQQDLGEEEMRVLRALVDHPRYKLRSILGIMNDTGLSREEVIRVLHDLKKKGLVREVAKLQRKGIRWSITSRGIQLLSYDKAQTR